MFPFEEANFSCVQLTCLCFPVFERAAVFMYLCVVFSPSCDFVPSQGGPSLVGVGAANGAQRLGA